MKTLSLSILFLCLIIFNSTAQDRALPGLPLTSVLLDYSDSLSTYSYSQNWLYAYNQDSIIDEIVIVEDVEKLNIKKTQMSLNTYVNKYH